MKTRTAAIAASATLIAALGIVYKVTQDRGYVPQTMEPAALLAASTTPNTIFPNGFDGLPRCAVGNANVTRVVGGAATWTNVLEWKNLYGTVSATEPPVPFPGAKTAQPMVIGLTPGQCLVEKYTVPANVSMMLFGSYTHGNTPFPPQSTVKASISMQPGDWSDSLGTGCYVDVWLADLSQRLNYRFDNKNPSQCHMKAGGTYYLNVLPDAHDPLCCTTYLKHERTNP